MELCPAHLSYALSCGSNRQPSPLGRAMNPSTLLLKPPMLHGLLEIHGDRYRSVPSLGRLQRDGWVTIAPWSQRKRRKKVTIMSGCPSCGQRAEAHQTNYRGRLMDNLWANSHTAKNNCFVGASSQEQDEAIASGANSHGGL